MKEEQNGQEYWYSLDYIEGSTLPALTRENVMFIEGILRLDPSYKGIADTNWKCDKDFDPIKACNTQSKGKKRKPTKGPYCSIAYWFQRMKESKTLSKHAYMGQ